MRALLDTCCIIWAVSDPASLSPLATETLEAEDSEIFISAISAAEIACAATRGRIILDRHWKSWLKFALTANQWYVEEISLAIIEEAYSLPDTFHSDPADRILVATARLNNYILLTADRKLIEYPHVQTIW
ncbi:MAG: type II toxin-antitoxin system VapC family toxin [Desulfobacteraceae bacterium]|nr:MAG: type II toxin-antitoxin system VapC family toxin [Desulfobacteraceae bacterium]